MIKRMLWLGVLALVAGGVQAADTAQDPSAVLKSLNWVRGPTEVEIGDRAKLTVPEGYVFLHEADTAKFEEALQNFSNGKETMFAPADLHWFAILDFDPVGYVKDDEKLDKDAILKSVKEGTEAANEERRKRGWATMQIVGWRFEPRYDPDTKRLEWAITARSDHGESINFNTRILGRKGVTSAVLVADPETLDAAVGAFKQVLTGYQYLPGQRYADVKSGDKMAEYGLAALIAGGGAAVAAKTGLLKTLMKFAIAGWKFILVGLAAVGAAIKRFFTGKKKAEA